MVTIQRNTWNDSEGGWLGANAMSRHQGIVILRVNRRGYLSLLKVSGDKIYTRSMAIPGIDFEICFSSAPCN